MQETFESYIPDAAVKGVAALLSYDELSVKIKKQRKTKHGDYRKLPNGKHQISINNNLNQYRFLITLIHEISHFEAFRNYGRKIKPHGKEWKLTFQKLMLPFINPEVFPSEILPLLARHFKNPKASSNSDENLFLALSRYDPPSDKNYVFEVPLGGYFLAQNGKTYKRGEKRVKRYECEEMSNRRLWLFNPNAKVDIINSLQKSKINIS